MSVFPIKYINKDTNVRGMFIMTYPMGIHRCLVFDGFETARFQKSRTKRSSKRLSIIMSSPPNRIDKSRLSAWRYDKGNGFVFFNKEKMLNFNFSLYTEEYYAFCRVR
jgi:hypothetical protein